MAASMLPDRRRCIAAVASLPVAAGAPPAVEVESEGEERGEGKGLDCDDGGTVMMAAAREKESSVW